MGTSKKPPQDDRDNDGIPDDGGTQAQASPGQDLDGDGVAGGETSIQSNPVIINR